MGTHENGKADAFLDPAVRREDGPRMGAKKNKRSGQEAEGVPHSFFYTPLAIDLPQPFKPLRVPGRNVCRMEKSTHKEIGNLMHTKSFFLAAFAVFFIALLVPSSVLAAGNQAGDIDQWANTTNKWQNGDLNTSNSHYREDFTVPYRAKLTGLVAGHSYTIPIEWD